MTLCHRETISEAVQRFVDMSPADRKIFDQIRSVNHKVLCKDATFERSLMLCSFICKTTVDPETDEWLVSPYGETMLLAAMASPSPRARYYALQLRDREVLDSLLDGRRYVDNASTELQGSGFVVVVSRNSGVSYELSELGRALSPMVDNHE